MHSKNLYCTVRINEGIFKRHYPEGQKIIIKDMGAAVQILYAFNNGTQFETALIPKSAVVETSEKIEFSINALLTHPSPTMRKIGLDMFKQQQDETDKPSAL